jgi:8-oxo-dGTP diphosphatase
MSLYYHLLQDARAKGISKIAVDPIILDSKGKILIIQRAAYKKFKPNAWCLPGGKVEDGETIEQALIRETKEELNLDVVKIIHNTKIIWDFEVQPGEILRMYYFIVKTKGEITLNHESQNYAFISKEDIPKYFPDYHERYVELSNWEYTEKYIQQNPNILT